MLARRLAQMGVGRRPAIAAAFAVLGLVALAIVIIEALPGKSLVQALPVLVEPFELHILRIDGSEPQVVFRSLEPADARWSPDGRHIAILTRAGQRLSRLQIALASTGKVDWTMDIEGEVAHWAWSPDGSRLAFISVATEADLPIETSRALVEVVNADGTGRRKLTPSSDRGPNLVGWAGAGKLVVLGSASSDADLMEYDVAAGSSRRIADLATAGQPTGGASDETWWLLALSPDGAKAAFVSLQDCLGSSCQTSPHTPRCSAFNHPDATGRFVVDLSASIRTVTLASGEMNTVVDGLCAVTSLRWSPSGQELAYAIFAPDPETGPDRNAGGVYTVNVQPGSTRHLTQPTDGVDYINAWLADGDGLIVARHPCYQCDGGETEAVLVTNGGEERPLSPRYFSASPDGKHALSLPQDGLPEIVGFDGPARHYFPPPAYEAWSPDSRAVTVMKGPEYGQRIYEIGIDGRNLRVLSRSGAGDTVALSPDGTRAAFVSLAVGKGMGVLRLANLDGSDEVIVGVAVDGSPRWAPDGRRLMVDSNGELYVVSADGDGLRKVGESNGRSAHYGEWSPDGKRFATLLAGSRGVAIIDVDSGQARTMASAWPSSTFSWSPDSRAVVFVDGGFGKQFDLFVLDVAGGGVKQLTTTPEVERGAAISPDGASVAFLRASGESEKYGSALVLVHLESGRESVLVAEGINSSGAGQGPVWSPDGRKLAFYSAHEDGPGIYVIASDGSGLYQLVLTPRQVSGLRWLDQKRIAFVVDVSGA